MQFAGDLLRASARNGNRLYRHYGGKQGCPAKWTYADEIEKKTLAEVARLTETELLEKMAAEAERVARENFVQDGKSKKLFTELDRQTNRLKTCISTET